MAYRTADYEQWKQLDFVVGIKISLSNNHTCKGYKGKATWMNICDELAGKYPKDFKFTGWHPHCRCHATPIMKTIAELHRDNERIMRGDEPLEEIENTVINVPEGFKNWLDDNKGRVKYVFSMPYFILMSFRKVSAAISGY